MAHRAPTRAPLAPPLLLVVLALLPLLAACGDEDAADASVETQPPPLPALALEPAFGGARFDRPIEVAAYPGGRLLVAEQPGRVTVLGPDGPDGPDGTAPALLIDLGPLIDIERGQGLLSVALDPGFEQNGQLWAYYFAAGEPPRSVLARFEVGAGVADPASALVVLELPQPGFNQNGGAIRFGPDGMLYLGLGDGSASTDPFENGQDLATLLGAVVRLDVRAASAAAPYVVPPDNPFVGVEGARPEIWAYGLRNPWRMAFDPASGELWLGDVGVSDAEEVDRIERGANYGWSIREGFVCLDRGGGCAGEGLTPPVAAYPHAAGRCAVTGGLVYRGDAIPALDGVYLYGDFCSGEIFALRPPAADAPPVEGEPPRVLATGAGAVVSFGLDAAGEVYIVDHGGGVWRLVAEWPALRAARVMVPARRPSSRPAAPREHGPVSAVACPSARGARLPSRSLGPPPRSRPSAPRRTLLPPDSQTLDERPLPPRRVSRTAGDRS